MIMMNWQVFHRKSIYTIGYKIRTIHWVKMPDGGTDCVRRWQERTSLHRTLFLIEHKYEHDSLKAVFEKSGSKQYVGAEIQHTDLQGISLILTDS